jgi:endonuclease/exonuclease/phosphatase family metal-dependent hydrolase
MLLRPLASALCLAACLAASGLTAPTPAAASAAASADASAAATAATTARARPPLRVVTFNVFQDLDTAQHRHDWRALRRHADVVLLQETAGFRVSDVVGTRRWKVFQAAGDRGESAVVVRRSAVRSATRRQVKHVLSAQDCAGAGIGPRFLVSVRLVLHDGTRLRVASTHLPHAGCSDVVYARMIRHLRAWVRHHPPRLVIGADWNRRVRSDPGRLGATTRLRPRGVGIDGFQVDQRLRVVRTSRLGHGADWASDHEPVRVTIRP